MPSTLSPLPSGPASPGAVPAPVRLPVPRDTWAFALALGAVLVVKVGWVTSVPW